jgi:DNA-binding HxlR family transcriptional regulator
LGAAALAAQSHRHEEGDVMGGITNRLATLEQREFMARQREAKRANALRVARINPEMSLTALAQRTGACVETLKRWLKEDGQALKG